MPRVTDPLLGSKELQRLREAELTYPEVGMTRCRMPDGYHRFQRSVVVGSGASRFDAAARTLLTWEMHRRAGLSVCPSSASVEEGVVAVVRLGPGRLAVRAPVRVVYVVDEPRRRGFAYGTLPGHPESGEEAFILELADSGDVTFTISAFSRPATWFARAGGPVARAIQSRVTSRYLRSL